MLGAFIPESPGDIVGIRILRSPVR
jgi:hypothetical protein